MYKMTEHHHPNWSNTGLCSSMRSPALPCTFTADAARTLPVAFVPAESHSHYEAVQETHHVLWRTQRCRMLLKHTKHMCFHTSIFSFNNLHKQFYTGRADLNLESINFLQTKLNYQQIRP